jgi:hypothetical protein
MDVDPGCGKRLDRDAKVDDNGGVWCNTCFVSPLFMVHFQVRSIKTTFPPFP